MNRISLSEKLIKTMIKIRGMEQVTQEIDLKLTKIPLIVELGEMRLGNDQMIVPFSASGHRGKVVLEKFHAAQKIVEFKFRIEEFNLLKIGIQYMGMVLLTILNLFGFSLVKRNGDKISIDLSEIFAKHLPEGLEIDLTSLKVEAGIEVIFN